MLGGFKSDPRRMPAMSELEMHIVTAIQHMISRPDADAIWERLPARVQRGESSAKHLFAGYLKKSQRTLWVLDPSYPRYEAWMLTDDGNNAAAKLDAYRGCYP
jgi:hypothetical protein